jgi:2-haloacid dehalogenase
VSKRSVVVFDLGGVIFDWNPRYLYRKILPTDDAVDEFLATVCTSDWNAKQDLGRSISEAVGELHQLHPDKIDLINAYYDRWDEAIGSTIEGTVRLLDRLSKRGVRLYALTNWPAETFAQARKRFDVLEIFSEIIVSGEVGLGKPDPRVFELMFARCAFNPQESVLVDDLIENIEVASGLGMYGIQFHSPEQTASELKKLGVL